ncbi:MAG: hypothetical protein APR55_10125 [Methanolinea sp. SDB]|nr:MAG: hypothetical protein APR55_10125 [Methanolinea sp. SDB]
MNQIIRDDTIPDQDDIEYKRVAKAVRRMASARTRGELAETIAEEISTYSLYELQVIGGTVKNEIDRLPSPYRERIRPYFDKQFFGMYHRLLSMHRSGKFFNLGEPISDEETFARFLAAVPAGCFENSGASGTEFSFGEPVRSLFYYLLSAFAMFVLEEPGHPVGTPFPGGFTVEKRGEDYFCPIRDKEEDIPFSICNFCPAKQMEGV